jgi:hypothetical protein
VSKHHSDVLDTCIHYSDNADNRISRLKLPVDSVTTERYVAHAIMRATVASLLLSKGIRHLEENAYSDSLVDEVTVNVLKVSP